jgi:hypothetical protein
MGSKKENKRKIASVKERKEIQIRREVKKNKWK